MQLLSLFTCLNVEVWRDEFYFTIFIAKLYNNAEYTIIDTQHNSTRLHR